MVSSVKAVRAARRKLPRHVGLSWQDSSLPNFTISHVHPNTALIFQAQMDVILLRKHVASERSKHGASPGPHLAARVQRIFGLPAYLKESLFPERDTDK
jgi:hypothetical protein